MPRLIGDGEVIITRFASVAVSVAASGAPTQLVTFASPFPSSVGTEYDVLSYIEGGNGDLSATGITAKTAGDCTVQLRNIDSVNAESGTLHVRAVAR